MDLSANMEIITDIPSERIPGSVSLNRTDRAESNSQHPWLPEVQTRKSENTKTTTAKNKWKNYQNIKELLISKKYIPVETVSSVLGERCVCWRL